MFGSRQFSRSFIILKVQDPGYGLYEGREPAGYGKLEIMNNHGSLLIYVQDLKPARQGQSIYDVVLVSNNDDIYPVKLTSIQIPDKGKGEYEITFDPRNVRESGNEIGQYHGLAIVDRDLKGERNLRFPLVGCSDKRVKLDWREGVTKQLIQMYGDAVQNEPAESEQTQKEDASGIIEDVQDAQKESEPDMSEEAELAEESADDGPAEEELLFEEPVENLSSDEEDNEMHNESEKTGIPEPEEESPLQEDIFEEAQFLSENISDESSILSEYNNTYWSKVESYYNNLFKNHIKVMPFEDGIGEVDWIRVENWDPGSWFDHYLIGLHRHLGRVRYVIYGIPGMYTAVPPMSVYGFSRWLPVKNGYGAGYWLLYIDAVTGNITYPI
ncbi:MAG: hypothetical protein ACOX22_01075 [Caldicoprobacterales bacterium]|mgnify:CR=1 FL=1|nr:hypothetical protein [Clostridiales bacterium]